MVAQNMKKEKKFLSAMIAVRTLNVAVCSSLVFNHQSLLLNSANTSSSCPGFTSTCFNFPQTECNIRYWPWQKKYMAPRKGICLRKWMCFLASSFVYNCVNNPSLFKCMVLHREKKPYGIKGTNMYTNTIISSKAAIMRAVQ